MPPDGLDQAVEVLEELPGEAGLADAGRADDRDEPGAPLAARGVEQVLEQPQLVVAADERRLEASRCGSGRRRSATTRRARQAGTGLALPLSACSPACLEGDGRDAARWVASPTRTVPGAATDWSRDAVLTRSPATMPWFVAPIVTAASPVRTPARASMPGPEGADRVDELEAGPDGPLGVVLVGDRRAPDRHDRVADELLDRPAVAADDVAGEVEVAGQELAGVLGVAPLGERREADEVGEQDGDEAALGDRRDRERRGSGTPRRGRWRGGSRRPEGWPHSPQNFSSGSLGAAGRAGGGERRPALDAEPPARLVLGAAVRADHRPRRVADRRPGDRLAMTPDSAPTRCVR